MFIVDFSSQGVGNYGLDGTVEILSTVVATSQALQLPPELQSICVETANGIHIPLELGRSVVEESPAPRERAPKGSLPPRSRNIRQINDLLRSAPRLVTPSQLAKNHDKPFYLYFDFIALKGEGIVGQTSSYVKESLELLFTSGLFSQNGIDSLKVWSDGCGKVYLFNSFKLLKIYVVFSISRLTVTSTTSPLSSIASKSSSASSSLLVSAITSAIPTSVITKLRSIIVLILFIHPY